MNDDNSTEHNKLMASSSQADLIAALQLLRQALGKRHLVDRWPGQQADEPYMIVRVHRENVARGDHSLRLVPYGAAPNVDNAPIDLDEHVVWVLPRRTPARTHETLRDRGDSFVALSGVVHLTLPWVFVDREGLKSPTIRRASTGRTIDPFADKSSLVLRVMLSGHARQIWGVRELAATAHVAVGTASRVVAALEDLQLVTAKTRGRALDVQLREPRKVLDAWTHAYSWRRNPHLAVHVAMGDPERFVRRLPKLLEGTLPKDARWALTMHAGAALVAPHAHWDRVHLYIGGASKQLARSLPVIAAHAGWEPAKDGALVLMTPYYASSVWYGVRTINGLPTVSDLQLALDLWHYPVRGREQAEHLLRRMLGQWDSPESTPHG
ncbi:MAG: hypothetical protein KGL93_11220 [Gemmatimonadota bacterium]|nr:hypothetical protein [Gemmatimonadota bacterium]